MKNGCLDVLLSVGSIHPLGFHQSFVGFDGFLSIFLFSWICPLIGFWCKDVFLKSCNQSSLELLVLVVLQHCNT